MGLDPMVKGPSAGVASTEAGASRTWHCLVGRAKKNLRIVVRTRSGHRSDRVTLPPLFALRARDGVVGDAGLVRVGPQV